MIISFLCLSLTIELHPSFPQYSCRAIRKQFTVISLIKFGSLQNKFPSHLNCGETLVMWYWARWRIRSLASRLFTQPFIQAQIKENIKAPRHWPLSGEFTGDLWIPRTKGQLRGKCFHLMTSSWIVSGMGPRSTLRDPGGSLAPPERHTTWQCLTSLISCRQVMTSQNLRQFSVTLVCQTKTNVNLTNRKPLIWCTG